MNSLESLGFLARILPSNCDENSKNSLMCSVYEIIQPKIERNTEPSSDTSAPTLAQQPTSASLLHSRKIKRSRDEVTDAPGDERPPPAKKPASTEVPCAPPPPKLVCCRTPNKARKNRKSLMSFTCTMKNGALSPGNYTLLCFRTCVPIPVDMIDGHAAHHEINVEGVPLRLLRLAMLQGLEDAEPLTLASFTHSEADSPFQRDVELDPPSEAKGLYLVALYQVVDGQYQLRAHSRPHSFVVHATDAAKDNFVLEFLENANSANLSEKQFTREVEKSMENNGFRPNRIGTISKKAVSWDAGIRQYRVTKAKLAMYQAIVRLKETHEAIRPPATLLLPTAPAPVELSSELLETVGASEDFEDDQSEITVDISENPCSDIPLLFPSHIPLLSDDIPSQHSLFDEEDNLVEIWGD